jgi:hypothetical protein
MGNRGIGEIVKNTRENSRPHGTRAPAAGSGTSITAVIFIGHDIWQSFNEDDNTRSYNLRSSDFGRFMIPYG